ncbi:MAG: 2OG-Fe(II) oxygenase [Blastocatellia bacterium]
MTRFIEVASEIAGRGWTVLNDFLPPETILLLCTEAQQLWQQEDFRAAGIGRSGGYAIRADIRSDHIRWLDEQALTLAQKVYWETIEELRLTLNRELFLNLASYESHFAIYPPGATYQKHLDRFSDADERTISCTLYLNEDWQAEEGGQLRLYLPGHDLAGRDLANGESAESYLEVLPVAGTCVLFRSDTFYHEVLPAARARFSLTGWFRRRSMRLV